MQMLNKIFFSIFLLPLSIFTCSELDNLNLYDQDTKIISLEYTQIFEESDKSNITGEIYFIKPNLFKITTLLPSKSDLIVNKKNVYRTDYILNETVQYDLEKVENQIPALLLLKSKKRVCSFLEDSEKSDFISNIKIFKTKNTLEKISYKDQFGINTTIIFSKLTINQELDRKIFDYNKDTSLIILN